MADAIGALYADMIFKYGFVHCDPHPGNLLSNFLTDNDQINKGSKELETGPVGSWLVQGIVEGIQD